MWVHTLPLLRLLLYLTLQARGNSMLLRSQVSGYLSSVKLYSCIVETFQWFNLTEAGETVCE